MHGQKETYPNEARNRILLKPCWLKPLINAEATHLGRMDVAWVIPRTHQDPSQQPSPQLSHKSNNNYKSTMSGEQPVNQASAAAASGLCKIDFSSSALLRQMSTMLRRVWLLDPPLSNEELANPTTVQECFRSMCEAIGNGITDDPENSQWDHELWLKHTQLKLLDPVVAASAETTDLRSVVSPWREEIYDVYRHLFSDLWRVLVAAASAERRGQMGRFDPTKGNAVSLVVLPAEETKVDKTAFKTDTFLYPVWVNPKAKISFAADGTEHAWRAEQEVTWTTGLWVQAGQEVALSTEMKDVEEDKSSIAAVFVTGHCEEITTEDTQTVDKDLAPAEAQAGTDT